MAIARAPIPVMKKGEYYDGSPLSATSSATRGVKGGYFFLCRFIFSLFLYLCLLIFLRLFLTTLPMVHPFVGYWKG